MDHVKVLLVGYRRSLGQELSRRGISFAVWDSRKLKNPGTAEFLRAPLKGDAGTLSSSARYFLPSGPYTHVMAGTEAGVYPAAVARRVLGSRLVPEATVLACHDKQIMKERLFNRGIPMTDFTGHFSEMSAQTLMERLGTPVVVKDRQLSGGRGIIFAENLKDLTEAMGPGMIYEKMIQAPEASIESFIHGGKILFTNITQYWEKKHVNVVPGQLSREICDQMKDLNRKVIEALQIQWGMTHLEVYLTPGGLLFGEIALRPPGGHIMELLEIVYGFNPWEVFVSVELGEFPSSLGNRPPHGVSAVWIVHPGEGTVAAVEGLENLRSRSEVKALRFPRNLRRTLGKRGGVGEELGHVIFQCSDSENLFETLKWAQGELKVKMEPL